MALFCIAVAGKRKNRLEAMIFLLKLIEIFIHFLRIPIFFVRAGNGNIGNQKKAVGFEKGAH